MVDCRTCGRELDHLAYTCNYCGCHHCSQHRLPEKHDCLALHLARPPESRKQDADAVPGRPRDFRGDMDVVDWVEHVRDTNLSEHLDTPDSEPDPVRETLESADVEASDEEIDATVENVKAELQNPSEKAYSTFKPQYTVGTQPAPEYASSPDLNPDGTFKTEPPGLREGENVGVENRYWLAYTLVTIAVLIVIVFFVLLVL